MSFLSTPGVPGILTLASTAGIGYAIATWYVASLGGMHPLGKVATNSIQLAFMAAVFWLWAAYKVVTKYDADFGIVTFAFAFLATYRTADLCAVQIRRETSRSKSPEKLVRMQMLQPAACFAVMINYLLVLVLKPTLPFSFQIYLTMGLITWSLAAIRGGWLLGDDRVVSALRDPSRPPPRKYAPNTERQELKYFIDSELSKA